MPKGELFINKKDAYATWGVSMNDTALSALMTPAPIKTLVENTNRMQHGKRVLVSNVRQDARELTVTFNLTARTADEFIKRYSAFCTDVLMAGKIDIQTAYQPDLEYHCIYVSCTQFSQYQQGIGMFVLKLVEPNPSFRTVTWDINPDV